MLKRLIRTPKRHGHALVFHFLVVHQNLPGPLLEKVHFGSSKIEFVVVFGFFLDVLESLLLVMLFWLQDRPGNSGRRAHFLITFIFFFYWLGGCAGGSNIFSNKEIRFVFVNLWLFVLLSLMVLIRLHKSHLLMVGRREHLLILRLLGKFRRENLRLDVRVRLDV